MVIKNLIFVYLIQALGVIEVFSFYCSPVLPSVVDHRNYTSGHVTKIDVHVTRDTSLCLVTRDGKVRSVLRVMQSKVQFHVREKREYRHEMQKGFLRLSLEGPFTKKKGDDEESFGVNNTLIYSTWRDRCLLSFGSTI